MDAGVVEVALPNGAVALVRVVELEARGAAKTSALTVFDLDEVGRVLAGIADVLKAALARAAPKSVSVELGLELAVKSGKLTGLLVDGQGTGSLKVTLTWGDA